MKHAILRIFIVAGLGICAFAPGLLAQTETNSLAPYVIETGDLDDYTTIKKAAFYRPDNLWNYINGGALPYLDYGVGDVVTFSGKFGSDGFEIVTDIYDMGGNLGAFGIYSNERYPDYDFNDLGVEGYVGDNAVSFWKDRFYVKIFANEAGIPSTEPLMTIARELDRRLPEGEGMSEYFDILPRENRMPKSETYAAKNVLGQDFLTRGFSARYQEGDSEYQFHIIECESPDDAKTKLDSYRKFIKEFGAVEQSDVTLGDELLVCREDWYGLMLFTRKGSFIAASVGLQDFDRSTAALESILKGLDKVR